jgi:Ca2+-binding EF-hand superfamily protein
MSITPKRLALLAATPLVVAGSLAFAQPAPAPAPDGPPAPVLLGDHGGRHGGHGGRDLFRGLFDEIDADADGSVTEAEVAAFRTAQLQAADANGDGNVSLDEFATVYFARIRPQMVDAFQAFDDDGDGAIAAAELEARFDGLVSRLDRNDDGVLSPDDRGPRRGGDDDDRR